MSTTTPSMPLPNDKSAPRWDGDYRTLTQFLLDYKRVADVAQYTDFQAIKAFINYIPEYLRGDVQNYEEFNPPKDPKAPDVDPTGDWGAFKTRLYKDFPRALDHGGYTRPEFWEFSARNFNRSLKTEDELETFARELRRYTTLLVRDGNLSAGDAGSVFEEILFNNHGEPFRSELHRQLGRKHTYTVDEIFTVAREFVKYDKKKKFFSPELAALVANRESVHQPSLSTGYPAELAAALAKLSPQHAPVAATLATQASPVSQDPQAAVMQQILQSIQTLTTAIASNGGSSAPRQQNGGRFGGPRGGSGWEGPSDVKCYYCGGQHIQPNCELLRTDMARGRCIRNQAGYVIFPNGDRIIQTKDMTNAQRVDHFNKIYPEFEQRAGAAAATTASTMLLQVSNHDEPRQPVLEVPTFGSAAAEEAWHELAKRQVFAFEQKKQDVEGTPRREGLRSRTKSQERSDESNKDDEPMKKAGSNEEPKRTVRFEEKRKAEESATAARRAFPSATIEEIVDEEAPRPRDTLPAQHDRPQYKIQSPLENEGLGKMIGERILETKVVLTVNEILALCPSVRRYWKDSSASRRVGVNLLEGGDAGAAGAGNDASAQVFRYRVMDEGNSSRDQITAARILPLRYLDCRIGRIEAEGVIDGGAQIVIVSQRLWVAIGKPIDPTHIMKLEAANNTNSRTLGLLANLEVEIGGLKLFLQAHVVEDAPFDLLLGRPFFALGCTIEETRNQGDSFITIHDPNSDLAVKIPTKERDVLARTPPTTAQGF